MSVASTKAFYAQVAAGFLLAFALADAIGVGRVRRSRTLQALRELPDAMEQVLARRGVDRCGGPALAPFRRYWAVVGNGANRIAAHEVRIKLSELCYKSIACDGTEDKKHIDLSAEPLILVCGAGLSGLERGRRRQGARDLPRAQGGGGRDRGRGRRPVRRRAGDHRGARGCTRRSASCCRAMAGHLFGYEAALAIDASARPLREARAAVGGRRRVTHRAWSPLAERLAEPGGPLLRPAAQRARTTARSRPRTAVRLASLFRYATGCCRSTRSRSSTARSAPRRRWSRTSPVALTRAIEELTRPVDAIKHQAKTVTVGISRVGRDAAAGAAGAAGARGRRGRATGSATGCCGRSWTSTPAVAEVTGFTRYRIDGDPRPTTRRSACSTRAACAMQLRSRTADNPTLRGTKQVVAAEREVTVIRGRSDGRTVVDRPRGQGGRRPSGSRCCTST